MGSEDVDQARDSMENLYYHFVSILSVLASLPAEQCDIMDNYNVAWELRDDGLLIDCLILQKFVSFTDSQIEEMKGLSSLLHSLEPDDYEVGAGFNRVANLKALSREAWILVRERAKGLLIDLASVTEENRRYLNISP